MNRWIDTSEYDEFQTMVANVFNKHGWDKTCGASCAVAKRTFKTIASPNDAIVFLSQYDAEHAYLTAEFITEGNNILITTTAILPKTSDKSAVDSIVRRYIADMENVIKRCRMVALASSE